MAKVHACSTLGWAAADRAAAIRQARAMGFTHVEIAELGAYCRHLPVFDTQPDEVARDLADAGLTLIAINASTARQVDGQIQRLSLARAADREQYHAQGTWFIDMAAALGAAVLTLSTSVRVADDASWNDAAAPAADALRRLADHAQQRGVSLCLEMPHLYQLQDSTAHALAMLDLCDHPALGVTLDSSHWGVIGYDIAAFVRALGPRLKHVHLRDSAGPDTRDFKQTLELTPGRGVVDFALLAATLDAAAFAGTCTLELEHRHADLPHITQQFAASREHLRQSGWNILDRSSR